MVEQPAGQDDTVRDDAFVRRVAPLKFREELSDAFGLFVVSMVFAGSFALAFLLFELHWPILLSTGLVTVVMMIPSGLQLRGMYRWHRRNVDQEGISLLVDEAGVYAGGRQPLRFDWPDVARVKLYWQYPPGSPETSASGPTDPWPELMITARSGWSRTWMLDEDEFQVVWSVVRRHAPEVL
jgi:hypothetical protein